jgi:hypothetical protein
VKPVANKVAFLKIDGQKVVYEKYDMLTGIFPHNVDIVPSGQIALVANNGASGAADGNVDTVSVIDLGQNPPRVIDHVVVGDTTQMNLYPREVCGSLSAERCGLLMHTPGDARGVQRIAKSKRAIPLGWSIGSKPLKV